LARPFFRFLFDNPNPIDKQYDKVYNIRISRGCTGECTYCAIKFATGPIRSRPLDKILAEFQAGLKTGYSVFRFIAEDVGGYGQDMGLNIADFLSNICSQKGDFQLIWDDFRPNWLIQYFPQLIDLFTNNINRFGYMGFPVQSGSEGILKLMARGHTAEDAKECLLGLKTRLPNLDLTTHFIIGFPGETEADVFDTINLGKALDFKNITVYKYDTRPNTEAAQFPNKVSVIEKYKRLLLVKREFKKSCLICP
jgi:tRNA A37 methylthiotransferase MiaB